MSASSDRCVNVTAPALQQSPVHPNKNPARSKLINVGGPVNQSINRFNSGNEANKKHNTNALQTTNIRRKKKETTRTTDSIHNTQMIYRLITYTHLKTLRLLKVADIKYN